MRLLPLLMPLIFVALTSCDHKSDQRAARYEETSCPTCLSAGVCHVCKGSTQCAQCQGTGTRTISTKNYGGEGLNLVEYSVECPFCFGDGTCHSCDNTGKCLQCEGDGIIDPNWETITHDPRKRSN